MKVLQYRIKWASGIDKWEYKMLFDTSETWIEEEIQQIHNNYDWSDKYRGVDYHLLDISDLNKEEIEMFIERYEKNIESYKKGIEVFKKILEMLKNEKK